MKKIRRAREVAESEGLENLFRKSWQFGADKFFTLPGIKRAARYLSVKKIEKRKEKEEEKKKKNHRKKTRASLTKKIQKTKKNRKIKKLVNLQIRDKIRG